jgi:hypothetical protein
VSRTEELEAILRERWTDDALLVYADHLQSISDPRGELIAMDLSSAPYSHPRYGELLRAWYGEYGIEVWWNADDEIWLAGRPDTWLIFDRGLVEVVHSAADPEILLRFLGSPLGAYVHQVSLRCTGDTLGFIVEALTARDRPWLRGLSLTRVDIDGDVAVADARAFAVTMPHLTRLEVSGSRVIAKLDHANLVELVVSGYQAVAAEALDVTTLDLAYWATDIDARITRARYPSLRRLVLDREEPGSETVFRRLALLDVAGQLTNLQLPSLRSLRDVRDVQAALDVMPSLREVRFARAYMQYGDLGRELRHDQARIHRPTAFAWSPADEIDDVEFMIDNVRCEPDRLIRHLEEQFSELPEPIQTIWTRLWILIGRSNGRREHFPASELSDALAALALDPADDRDWLSVRDRLDDTRLDDPYREVQIAW